MSSQSGTAEVDANVERVARKSNIFDFLRLLAASAVVIGHSNMEFGTNFAWGAFSLIDGVPMFFIMSGMLVYLSAEKIYERTGQWRDFFLNRYLRIAPALYVFAVLCPLVFVAVGAVTIGSLVNPDLALWLGSFLVLLPGYDMPAWENVGVGAVTWPLYTIPAEVSFYLVTPILVIVAKKFGFWKMLAPLLIVAVAGGVAYYLTGGSGIVNYALNHTFLHQGACFAMGVFWARYWGRIPVRWWVALVALAAYLSLNVFGDGPIYGALKPILIAVPLSVLIVFAGYNGPKFLSTLTNRVGDLSFATYIWHYLVINVLLWFGLTGQWWNTALALLISWLVAAGSWWLVERNALRLKRVSLRSPTQQRQAPVSKS